MVLQNYIDNLTWVVAVLWLAAITDQIQPAITPRYQQIKVNFFLSCTITNDECLILLSTYKPRAGKWVKA